MSVETTQPGQSCAVNSVEKAAEQLFAWPDRGPEWRRAVDCCADALTGQMSVAQVRAAFLVAARAAGRLIDSDPSNENLVAGEHPSASRNETLRRTGTPPGR